MAAVVGEPPAAAADAALELERLASLKAKRVPSYSFVLPNVLRELISFRSLRAMCTAFQVLKRHNAPGS
jgi:hypothetical protein